MSPMRLLVLALVLPLAGCLDSGTAPLEITSLEAEAHAPRPGEYAFVWVTGERVWEHVGGEEGARAVCDVAWDHDVDPENRRITYQDRYDFSRPTTLVAFDVWDQRSSCPVAYELTAKRDASRGLGGDPIRIEVTPDGRLTVDGQNVPIGAQATWQRTGQEHEGGGTYRTTLTVHIENRGGWPSSGLVAQD